MKCMHPDSLRNGNDLSDCNQPYYGRAGLPGRIYIMGMAFSFDEGTTPPSINPYLFEKQFEAFRVFVEATSGMAFASFASNPYTTREEGYKYKLWDEALAGLDM
jgi:hypothetical protein